jgi:hypothetical protein
MGRKKKNMENNITSGVGQPVNIRIETTSSPAVEIRADVTPTTVKTCVPPIKLVRNSYGLLENIDYVFTPDGFVDWRKLLKPEFLAINKQYQEVLEKKHKKPLAEIDIVKDEVEDKYLLILLAGIKWLAGVRGFRSVRYSWQTNDTAAYCCCIIDWLPNYETENKGVEFESLAECNDGNTSGIFKSFKLALAENRAFTRCVRNFLKINIVGQEEIVGAKGSPEEAVSEDVRPGTPAAALKNYLDSRSLTWEKVRENISQKKKDKYPDVDNWISLTSVPPQEVLKIITDLKTKENAKTV